MSTDTFLITAAECAMQNMPPHILNSMKSKDLIGLRNTMLEFATRVLNEPVERREASEEITIKIVKQQLTELQELKSYE